MSMCRGKFSSGSLVLAAKNGQKGNPNRPIRPNKGGEGGRNVNYGCACFSPFSEGTISGLVNTPI